jgi:hypothetical protein
MSESNKNKTPQNVLGGSGVSRKSFLKYAGASAAAATTFGLIGCDEDDAPMGPNPGGDEPVDLGSGNVSILNFAYALEQLEAAFYIEVMNNQFGDMTDEEGTILEDLRKHEVAHRDWFSAVLDSVAPDAKIPGLEVDFSSVDFSNRMSVLGTAAALEETGVGAYNGAGAFIDVSTDSGAAYLLQAGKIVSVEARHASAINNLLNPGSADFAGDRDSNGFGADENGLDQAFTVDQVLALAGPFITTELDASNVGQ